MATSETIDEFTLKLTMNADDFLKWKGKVDKALDNLDNKARTTSKDIANHGDKAALYFEKISKSALKFFGVALGIEGVKRFFGEMTHSLMDMGNAAAYLDIPIRQLDGINRAAQAAGISVQAMGGLMMRLENSLAWIHHPMGAPDATTIALQQLSQESHVAIFKAKNAKEMLVNTFKAIHDLPNHWARVQYGNRLGFNDAMINKAEKGDIDAAIKEYEKKSTLTDDAYNKAKKIQEMSTDIRQQFFNISSDIEEKLEPALEKLLPIMEAFIDYVKNHENDITGFFEGGTSAVVTFTDAVGGANNAIKILMGLLAVVAGNKAFQVFSSAIEAAPMLTSLGTGLGAGFWPSNLGQDQSMLQLQKLNEFAQIHPMSPNDVSGALTLANIKQQNDSVIAKHLKQPTGRMSKQMMNTYQNLFDHLDQTLGQGAGVAAALAMTESSGDPTAISKSNAIGLWQLGPDTAKDYFGPNNIMQLTDPYTEGPAAMDYLKKMLKHYNGNWMYALMAYNAGPNRFDRFLAGKGEKPLKQETLDYPYKFLSYLEQYEANRASSKGGSVSNSSQETHFHHIDITSDAATIDQLQEDIMQKSKRARLNLPHTSGVS